MVRIARFHRADTGSIPDMGSSLTTLIKIVQNKMWLMVKGKRDKMFARGEHGIAGLAQSVERRAFNLVVVGSIPTVGICTQRCKLISQKIEARNIAVL